MRRDPAKTHLPPGDGAVKVAIAVPTAAPESAANSAIQSLFLHARARIPRGAPHAAALAHARHWFAWLPSGWDRTGWDDADWLTLSDLRSEQNLGRVFRVPARVAGAMPAAVYPVPEPGADSRFRQRAAQIWTLEDADGARIETLPIVSPSRFDTFSAPPTRDDPHEFLLLVVAVPTVLVADPESDVEDVRREFVVYVLDARPTDSALALIAATRDERARANATLAALRKKRIPPSKFLVRELKRQLRVVGYAELDDAIELAVLQSLSTGFIGVDSARIHILVLGAPGQGKGFVTAVARVLALVSIEVQASDVTVPGLRGPVRPTAIGWGQEPGVYTRANRGVIAIPDAHAVPPQRVKPIASSLHGIMDRGTIGMGTSGARERHVLVAVCMDGNRHEHMELREAGAGRKRNPMLNELQSLVSRFDGLIDIPDNSDRAWETSSHLVEKLQARVSPKKAPAWGRELRVLAATLLDRRPLVDIGKQRKALSAAQSKFRQYVTERAEAFPDASFLANRLVITRAKFALALARGADRAAPTADDVREAERLTWLKVYSLERAGRAALERAALAREARKRPGRGGRTATESMHARLRFYVEHFGGKEPTRAEIKKKHLREMGVPLSEATLTRHLAVLGARRMARGRFLIPPRMPTSPERPPSSSRAR